MLNSRHKKISCPNYIEKDKFILQTSFFKIGFQNVPLRELQSDRIWGEFSVYRQSNGANAFMTAGDVMCAFKTRLVLFVASYPETIDVCM